jgi:hypothetical protein
MGRIIQKDGRSFQYYTCIQETARRLARHVTVGKGRLDFSLPFKLDVGSYLPSQVKDSLLAMTLEERKAAGISKTTWHYIRKRVGEGRPLRLYRKVASRIL